MSSNFSGINRIGSLQIRDVNRTATPGEVVLPISELFDRLQSKIDASTLEQILRDIISGRRDRVSPGEIITAELMNQILTQLESLETRVTKLEAGSTPGQAPFIRRLVPPETETMRVNQTIQAIGGNFGFTTGSLRLTVDGIPVTVFDTSLSNNEQLVFNIPALPNLPQTGRAVDLIASVGNLSAQKRITVLPVNTTQRGRVTPSFVSVDPTRIVPGAATPLFFRYNLVAGTLFPATFLITPTVSAPQTLTGIGNASEWQNRLVVLNRERQPIPARQLSLGTDEETVFFLHVPGVPSLPPAGNITIRVDVTAEGVETGTDSRTFPLGEVIEEDTSIELPSPATAEPSSALSGTTVRLGPNGTVNISLGLRFTQILNPTAGDRFDLSAAVVDGTGWTSDVAQGMPRTLTVRTAGAQASADFNVSAGPSPSASGRVEFRIQRQGGTRRRTFQFILSRV